MSDVTGKPFGDIYAYIDRQIAAAVLAAATDHQTLSHRLRPYDGHDLYPRVDGARGMDSGANLEQGREPVTDLETATRAWVLAQVGGVTNAFVDEDEITGSAATQLQVSGLDLSTDQEYDIRAEFKNANAGSVTFYLMVNSNTTATNYYRQTIGGNNTTIGGTRDNTPTIQASAPTAQIFTLRGRMSLDFTGRPKLQGTVTYGTAASNIQHVTFSWEYNSVANVTSIEIYGATASSIAVGSKMKVFRNTGGTA